MSHTPHDSLQFIYASASLLDWIAEEIAGINSDEPDIDLAIDALGSFQSLIRAEVDVHGWRNTYSTGHPVHVERQHRQIEPDPDGGFDRLVWVPYIHTCKPDGTVIGDPDESP